VPFFGTPATFVGPLSQKQKKPDGAHHSIEYKDALHVESKMVRNSMRKWNLFISRINGNKVQPDAVTEKVSKPKFDRKEKEIWNN
ncbi:MAG: hypothetical protein OEY56_07345, partial [Cyclobacteriaceae bacterium]|nr:hypothetical protein [Cyclobacteriaceae bacterium]